MAHASHPARDEPESAPAQRQAWRLRYHVGDLVPITLVTVVGLAIGLVAQGGGLWW